MEEEEIFYLVLQIQPFEFETNIPCMKSPSIDSGGMVGYAPIYALKEDAEKDFPNAEIVAVKRSQE